MIRVIELSLGEIGSILWARRYWLFGAFVGALIAILVFALVSSSKYEATVTVISNDLETNNELISFQSPLLGFADFGGGDIGPFELFLDTLRSDEVYDRLYKSDSNLIHELLRSSGNERENNVISLSVLSPSRYVNFLYGLPVNVPIDGERTRQYIGPMVQIENRAEIVRITARHEDRELVLRFLSLLISNADEIVREGYSKSIEKRIDFISEYLQKPRPVSIVGSLSRRQETLLAHFVALEVDGNYSFHIVAGPTAGAIAKPPPLMLMTTIFLASFLGAAACVSIVISPSKYHG